VICYNDEGIFFYLSHNGGNEMSAIYTNNYVIVAIFLILGVLLPVATVSIIGPLVRPKNPTPEKQTTYESGNIPVGDSWVRFNVKYYIFALLFVIFDVETLFLYPWAVAYNQLGLFALVEMVIFITLLVVGLIYAWRKKVLEWN
jgi:NADH-quinone oxidoreductase subunit A